MEPSDDAENDAQVCGLAPVFCTPGRVRAPLFRGAQARRTYKGHAAQAAPAASPGAPAEDPAAEELT